MSFQIKCNECGYEQEFKKLDKARNTKIDIEVNMHWVGDQQDIDHITIYCENPNCVNHVDLEY